MILFKGFSGLKIFLFKSKKRVIFLIWLLVALFMWTFLADESTKFSAFGVLISGISTFLFWNFREPLYRWVTGVRLSPGKKFVLIGVLAAAWVEFEFWLLEKIFGVTLAVSPNIFLDLLVTLPWYAIMVFLFWKVQKKYTYNYYTVLMYGGIYDFFADGILGTIISTGTVSPETIFVLLISFPVFVLSYSFILLPACFLLKDEFTSVQIQIQTSSRKKYVTGLLPLLGLLVYGIITIIIF